MKTDSERWKEITRSNFPWEVAALAFVRDGLPDREPFRAWANFEFFGDDGSINEVDLLALTPKGLFLIEIKSRPGKITGDSGTWTWTHDGKTRSIDNPLLLANRKAKKLKSLLARQKAFQHQQGTRRLEVPWIKPLIFLSAEDLDCQLPGYAREGICLRDRDLDRDQNAETEDGGGAAGTATSGILAAIRDEAPYAQVDRRSRRKVDAPMARTMVRAMEQAGIRPSRASRRVSDYEISDVIAEGATWQDFAAEHVSFPNSLRRVRIYSVSAAADADTRSTIERAARREYQVLHGIQHPGILCPQHFTEHDLGPALVFEVDNDSQRLDHFLRDQGDRLGVDERLAIVRQIAEALAYAHEKKLYHRALSPQSILVSARDGAPQVRLFNWQTASRSIDSSGGVAGTTLTRHLDRLVDDTVEAWLAPEALSTQDPSGEALDVFGLGSVAYFVFSGQAPAATALELAQKLRESGRTGDSGEATDTVRKGLDVGAVLDGAGEDLRELIRSATHPEVTSRLASVGDFAFGLNLVEAELTRPQDDFVADPSAARAGDILEGGFQVIKRLGSGSTAIVFLVDRGDGEVVLKLANDPRHNDSLRNEADVLQKLRHQSIIPILDTVEMYGRVGLLLENAGDQTLTKWLRDEGRLHVDYLERFGEELLAAIEWLEEQGVPHRDLKPENIAISGYGPSKGPRHLMLFDFSLSRAPAEEIRAGTPPYLEPFLVNRKPPRWDPAAERFAAAMVLHEMAAGTLPVWGDGKSDAAVLDCEVTLEPELFDASLREPLGSFFEQALRRDPKQRFDNASEMRRAWRRAFEHASRPAIGPAKDAVDARAAFDTATAETLLVTLGLSTRAVNALERADATTVADLLAVPVAEISHMRGVGNKTRRELLEVIRRLAKRFPELADRTRRRKPAAATETEDAATRRDTPPAEDEPAVQSVDLLVKLLLPAKKTKGATTESEALECLLGLDDSFAHSGGWPAQSAVAKVIGKTRARVSQALVAARKRWSKNASIASVRDDIARLLSEQGCAMSVRELTEAILDVRGSSAVEDERRRRGRAVVRAAAEAESAAEAARFLVRRLGKGAEPEIAGASNIFIVRDLPADASAGTASGTASGTRSVGAASIGDWVDRLGRAARELAGADPLASPARAVEVLRAVRAPEGFALPPDSRLVRLAAEASGAAAVSSRLEIYPVGMSAERALRLSYGALLGPKTLTPQQVQDRVRSRYPEAAPLPSRPELDTLLRNIGLDLEWDSSAADSHGAYRVPTRAGIELTSGSTLLSRRPTAGGTGYGTFDTAELAEARTFEDRLARAAREGAFLVLSVDPRYLLRAEREIQRFGIRLLSLEAELLADLRGEAEAAGVDWPVVLAADTAAAGTEDHRNLRMLARRAVARLETRLTENDANADRTLVLTRPGLLRRFDDVGLIERLRDRVGVRAGASAASESEVSDDPNRARNRDTNGSGLFGLWLLVPSSDQSARPLLDGAAVPVITAAQWVRIPETWLENRHRAEATS